MLRLMCLAAMFGAEPLVRETNYLVLLPGRGEELRVAIASRQHAKIYADELQYALLAGGGRVLARERLALGAKGLLKMVVPDEGLLALELTAGWNACLVDPGSTRSAWLASALHPLHVVGASGPYFFYVPRGCRRFSVSLVAGAPREGARLVLRTPDGRTVKEEEDDFDSPARIRVEAPKQSDGQAWTLALEKPKAKELHADDVVLWLDSAVAPYLCHRADWALEFGRRQHR